MLPLPRGAVWQLLFLFCAALYINGVRSDGRVVCYYTNWSVYRPGTAKFNPQNINPYLCTHLIYAFGGFTKDNQMKPFDKYQDIEQGGYAKFTGLKTYNKQLKTMIAIGGWNEASSRFSPLVANPERRQKFIKNILKFLRQNHFDGIDLDWEYPAHREGGKPRDRDNYAQFVQELRAEFERESEKTGRPRLLLTMAVPAGIEYIEKGYDIPKLNKYLDWFNLLTYDFHSSHEPSVNHHAPLYSLEEESEYNYDAELNIDYSIKFYLNAGADRDKLVLGIPTYGRSYTLINEESTEIGAPAEAPGEQGDATREKGYLAYYEICQNIKEDPEWTVVQPNPNAMGPYAYRRNQWVGYDDEAIVRKKAQYVVENGLGGIMFWAIDNDDFRGICTGKQYPLIEAAKEAMLDALGFGINEVSKPSAPQKPSRSRSRENSASTRNRITTTEHKLTYAERKGSTKRVQIAQQSSSTRSKPQTSTTEAPIKLTEVEGSSLYIGGRTTTPPPPTTPDPGTDFKCEEEGFFQHPRDCKKYYWCLDSGPSGLGIVAHQFTCPSGLYFNPAADSCDFARNVPCKTKKSTTAAPITTPATTTTTTTPRPNRLTAATSRPTTFFRTTPRTTTTTTTEASEEDIEYEEEENSAPSPFAKRKGSDKDAEEDPKVIKELIELIRKVGGIEELEKHLLRKEDGTISIKENSSSSSSSSAFTATTPSTISKSLYEKVLSKPNALNSFRNRFTSTSSFRTTKTQTKTQDNAAAEVEIEETHETDNKSSGATTGFSKYSSVVRGNSRQGPQNEGISKLSEFDGFLKEKKQYITINRNRGTKKTSDVEEDEEVDEEVSKTKSGSLTQEEEEEYDVKTTRKAFSSATPSYSTIRRTRPTTTTEASNDEAEDTEEKEVTERKSYSTLNRSRSKATTTTETPDVVEVTSGSTRYKYLERTRPTRPTTESSNKVAEEEDTINTEVEEDDEAKNKENTVHYKAVNIENTRETQQQDITTNTQRSYASIGRRTTTSTPDTETTTDGAAKTSTTTTAAPPTTTTTSTTETPITTPLTILETTTPDSISLTTNIPITTTTTNPTTISTTTITTTTTKTTTLPNGEDVLGTSTTTPVPNEINSDISETLDSSLHLNSLLTESSISSTTPLPTTESGLDTNEQEIDSHSTTTEATTSSTTATVLNGNDKLTKTADTQEHEEVNLVNKQRNKTLYNTRTRTTTTTTKTLPTITTNSDIETTTTTSPTNAKKTLGVRRQQQVLLNRSSQTKTITTDTPLTTTESVNNDFLGTVSSPRPFGFPKRRTRPSNNAAGTTTTSAISNTTDEEVVKSTEESLITKQKASTKLNAAANSQTKKYQFQRRTTTTKATITRTRTTTPTPTTTTEKSLAYKKEEHHDAVAKTQVNVNEGNESEISTNIPEKTSAPTTTTTTITTTESPSGPAAPLTRRLKVLKLKRPLVSSSNNTNITANTTTITTTATVNDSSATNLNASHTDTQNIVKLSSVSDIDTQIVKTQTLTQTEITDTIDTHSVKPLQISPTPKRFRKVIRKLIRPVNRTSESTNQETQQVDKAPTTSTTFSQRRQNVTRYGYNRSSKQYNSPTESKTYAENHDSSEEEKEEKEGDLVNEAKAEQSLSSLLNRGRNKFTLPASVSSTTKSSLFGSTNRNRFSNRLQTVKTFTDSDKLSKENSEEDEDEDEDDIEDKVTETVAKTFISKPTTKSSLLSAVNRNRYSNRVHTLTTTTEKTNVSEQSREDDNDNDDEEEDEVTENVQQVLTSKPTVKSSLDEARLQTVTTTTTENTKALKPHLSEDEGDDDDDDDDEEDDEVTATTVESHTEANLSTTSAFTENVSQVKEEFESTPSSQIESTTSKIESFTTKTELPTNPPLNLEKLRNKVKTDQTIQSNEGISNERLKLFKSPHNNESQTDDPLLKLRNKVKQDLAKGSQEEKGVLSTRFKSSQSTEQPHEKDDPFLKLRNKVKQDLAKGNQVEGVLTERFNSLKTTTEVDDPLLKLRNKVKQELAKGEQEEGVVNLKLKKLLESKNTTSGVTYRVEETEHETTTTQESLNLQKIRNKVQTNLAKNDQDLGVVSSRLKKLLSEKTSSTNIQLNDVEEEEDEEKESSGDDDLLETNKPLTTRRPFVPKNSSTELKESSGDGDLLETNKPVTTRRPFVPKTSSTELKESSGDDDLLETIKPATTRRPFVSKTSSTELKESSGDGDVLETNKPITTRRPFVPKTRLTLEHTDAQTDEIEESVTTTTSAPRTKPTFRRKLVAKRPYTPTKPPLSALRTTTIKIPTTKGKNKYVRRKFGRFHPFNASNRNTGEGFIRKDPRGNILPGTDRFKVEGSAGGQTGDGGEDYEEYDEEDEDEGNDDGEEQEIEKEEIKPIQAIKPVINRPPGLFNRPPATILKNPTEQSSKEQSSAEEDEEEEDETDDEEEEDEEEEEEKEKEDDSETVGKTEQSPIARPTYKPKDNRIPPGARPALTTTPTIKKPNTPSRVANTPYRTDSGSQSATTVGNRGNRFGSSSSRSTVKPRVVNRPNGVSVPSLTIRPVANDFERTTVLIPTKPAPFINPNTRAYERKYTGPTTESSVDLIGDNNPLIEDLNIEALNARNKKIFDINSKKHTTLKPKVVTPLIQLTEDTAQETLNTENENDEGYHQSSVNGLSTITTTITTDTITQQQQQEQHEHEHEQEYEHEQEQEQSTLQQDNTNNTGTQDTQDENLSNPNNLNEISSQAGYTTTPTPSTTLLHIFTIADGEEHVTRNPLEDGYQVVPRLIVERNKPKHKVVEINRIVEVNSKEEKLRRKSKANIAIPVEGSETFKVESLPHIEQLGEISVVKYVHQVDGSDITIEGRSTVTDYTPTEPTVPDRPQPIRHTLPDGSAVEERSGKALLPEVLREAIETSTISLEGLFESARKGKVLNTVDEVTGATVEQIETTTEKSTTPAANFAEVSNINSFSILNSVAFDKAKINFETDSEETETNGSKKSIESSSSSTTSTLASSEQQQHMESTKLAELPITTTTTVPVAELLNVETSTVAKEESKATTVAAALFPQYLRPTTTANSNGFTVTRRPVLSVRRRLINLSTAATAISASSSPAVTTTPNLITLPVSSSTLNDDFTTTTSKFKRLRTNRPPTINSAAVDITTTVTAATASFKLNSQQKKKSSETSSNDLRLASSSLTSSSADNDITARQSQSSSAALRRKYQARRLTTPTSSNTNSDGSATEPPRTQNPLFKRRFSLTTFSPLPGKTLLPSSSLSKATTSTSPSATATLRTGIDSLTTTVYVDGLENDEATDQVAKSSIHTSRFNQINGRLHIDDDDDEDVETLAGGGGVGDLSHVVNTVKTITTLSPATKQPELPSPLQEQHQQQTYSKYNFEDVITRRMDGTGTVAKSPDSTTTGTSTTTTTTPTTVIKKRKMIIKRRPQKATPSSELASVSSSKRRRPNKYQEPYSRLNSNQEKTVAKPSQQSARTYRPNLDYDYYDDEDVRLVGNKNDQQLKVILHGGGIIECLDQGNFPHPLSCRKFISCAKFETGGVVGWEYTCPKGLSYDPVGGMCNWAAGLGCKE